MPTALPFVIAAALLNLPDPTQPVTAKPPLLAPVDAAAGWSLLTGPDAASRWRGYKQAAFPAKGWSAQNGVLTHAAGGGGGDLVSAEQYADLELVFDFKTSPKSNSGVMFRVAEKHDTTWQTGPEYQVIDDAGNALKPDDAHSSGAMYDLYPPTVAEQAAGAGGPGETGAGGKTLRPAGEWNSGRIRLRDGVVQHWLNGVKLVEARLFNDDGTPTKEWLDKIAGSKFKAYEGFGVQPTGFVALQDHGDEIAFRNVMARDLAAPRPGEVALFNGKDLTGWTAVVPDAAKAGIKPEDVWSVMHEGKDGVLVCKGNPVGYIRTNADYKNYVLFVEWRFNPVTKKAGNSGVLLRMIGEDKVWPKSIEAQLHSENAGDFWNIDNYTMTVDPARTKGRNTKKTHMAERPVGEWNEYEIIVNRGTIILKVNGEELNRATGVEDNAGKICLQSEGAQIQFRRVRLVPLE